MLALPLPHGDAGWLDELIVLVEGIVIAALIITYVRNRKRGAPPGAEPPSPPAPTE